MISNFYAAWLIDFKTGNWSHCYDCTESTVQVFVQMWNMTNP